MTTVLLVDDDPFEATVRRAVLKRCFRDVERAADAAEAFILIEDRLFAEKLGLVIVGLNRPGLGTTEFVAELTSRLPSVPVLVLGALTHEGSLYPNENVRVVPRSVPTHEMLAVSRQMMEPDAARVA